MGTNRLNLITMKTTTPNKEVIKSLKAMLKAESPVAYILSLSKEDREDLIQLVNLSEKVLIKIGRTKS